MASGRDVVQALVVAAGAVLGALAAQAALRKSGVKLPELPSPFGPDASGRSPALVQLLKQIDASYPSRSRGQDGMLPSAAHHAQNPNSDHERGDALDVTFDFMNGPNLDQLASDLLADGRVTYVIWNRRIANRSIDSGAWRPYAQTAVQTDPHTGHLHVSVDHSRRSDDGPWSIVIVPEPPAGYAHMPDRSVTPELATWAKTLLTDKTFGMGQTRTKAFGGKTVLARIEVHSPSRTIDHPHRGVSLFEPVALVA
jgi:hypothetical protein